MYWPIGAPRIYSDQGAATQEASDDDEESSDEGGNPVAGEPTLDANGNARDEIALISGPPTPATPNTEHGINDLQTPTTPRFPLPAATRPVRAFEVARSGHLFAVITDRALTIWQSKVRDYRPAKMCARADLFSLLSFWPVRFDRTSLCKHTGIMSPSCFDPILPSLWCRRLVATLSHIPWHRIPVPVYTKPDSMILRADSHVDIVTLALHEHKEGMGSSGVPEKVEVRGKSVSDFAWSSRLMLVFARLWLWTMS